MTPHPKPEKHRKRKKPGRLYGAKLKAQNEAIIIRDGDRCGVCRIPPPTGNHSWLYILEASIKARCPGVG